MGSGVNLRHNRRSMYTVQMRTQTLLNDYRKLKTQISDDKLIVACCHFVCRPTAMTNTNTESVRKNKKSNVYRCQSTGGNIETRKKILFAFEGWESRETWKGKKTYPIIFLLFIVVYFSSNIFAIFVAAAAAAAPAAAAAAEIVIHCCVMNTGWQLQEILFRKGWAMRRQQAQCNGKEKKTKSTSTSVWEKKLGRVNIVS